MMAVEGRKDPDLDAAQLRLQLNPALEKITHLVCLLVVEGQQIHARFLNTLHTARPKPVYMRREAHGARC